MPTLLTGFIKRTSALPGSLMALVAIIQCVVFLLFYRRGVYVDQWDLVPILEAFLSGGDWLSLTLVQHGGHYHTTAYLIMLPLAKLSHWNLIYETLVILMVNLLSFYLLYKAFLQNVVSNRTRISILVGLTFSVIYFSLGHGANALWSWQLCVYLCLFGACLSLYAFSLDRLSIVSVCIAMLGSVIATFSYSSGFALWPIGAGLILFRHQLILSTRLFFTILWLSTGGLICVYYLQNMHNTGMNHGIEVNLGEMLLFLLYYLGTPIAYFSRDLSLIVASLGALVFCYLSIKLVFYRIGENRNGLMLVLALAAFAIISGLLIALGRLEFGFDQARSFRYLIFSQFFWFSLLLLIWQNSKLNEPADRPWITYALIPILIMTVFTSQKTGRSVAQLSRSDNQVFKQIVASPTAEKTALLSQLNYPPQKLLLQHLAVLEDYELNYYRAD